MAQSFLQVHSWYVDFNILHEFPRNGYVWVNLPILPLELWIKQVFMEIGNEIGRFIYMDPRIFGAKDKSVALILIKTNFSGGLPTKK